MTEAKNPDKRQDVTRPCWFCGHPEYAHCSHCMECGCKEFRPETRWTPFTWLWYLWKGSWARDGWLRNSFRASPGTLQGRGALPLPPAPQQPRTPDQSPAPAHDPAVPLVAKSSEYAPKPSGLRARARSNTPQGRSDIFRNDRLAPPPPVTGSRRGFDSSGLSDRLAEDIQGLNEVRGYLMHANEHPENLDHPMLDKVEEAESTLHWLRGQIKAGLVTVSKS